MRKLSSVGLYLCICSVSFGGSYWPVRAVLYLLETQWRVVVSRGWAGGAVGMEASLGKQGLSTRREPAPRVWTGGTSAGGVGGLQVCVFISQREKKRWMRW